MGLTLKTAPAKTPITLDEAKAQCNVTHTRQDTYITSLVAAATAGADGARGVLGRAIVTQEWVWTMPAFPPLNGSLRVPLPPLQSVDAIQYLDSSGASQTLDPAVYGVDTGREPAVLFVKDGQSWPSTLTQEDAVTITFTAGFGADETEVPEALKQALLIQVADFYFNRTEIQVGKTVSWTKAAERLMAQWTVHNIEPAQPDRGLSAYRAGVWR